MVREEILEKWHLAASRLGNANSIVQKNARRARRALEEEERKIRVAVEQAAGNSPFSRRDSVKSGSYSSKIFNPQSTTREHSFQVKKVMNPKKKCSVCGERINTGIYTMALKCENCIAMVHIKCKEKLPIPCVPTPKDCKYEGEKKPIECYAPKVSPMVPSLVVHCIREIESRGMEEGLYRVSGNAQHIKNLKELFEKHKKAPILLNFDIPTIASALKSFLASLSEPLITIELRDEFIRAAMKSDKILLIHSIEKLPEPNRDTLAFLLLHLQRVIKKKSCRMDRNNLARVFGPTLVGEGTAAVTIETLDTETKKQTAVVNALLEISPNYWRKFVGDRQRLSGTAPLDMPEDSEPGDMISVPLRRSWSSRLKRNPFRRSNSYSKKIRNASGQSWNSVSSRQLLE
ncbi:rac GTPase-activating protein 1-like [Venturia canescens]|uniref:rac GTPase-activating protein 1-like n=1 Tax=Venturia canescens TaxID=32260 RepID=UPI001C9D5291|nr:rac GTPase-activating protein 1-like [Venturia canescens]